MMEKILLHICCGICASSVVERLRTEGFQPIGFFYNPNIHPKVEYLRREEIVKGVAKILKFELILGSYDKDGWFAETRSLENEPEGGKRCNLCFQMRLQEANRKARELGLGYFTTTLTVSPHKSTPVINEIGKAVSPLGFIIRDFKKQHGFRLAIEFANRYNLSRQNYCGCIYSKNAKRKSIIKTDR